MFGAAPTQPNTQPSRSGRLLALVRKLIDYGRELAATLQQGGAAGDLVPILRAFGTRDIARILARIMCGLHRAQSLEDRIIQNAAWLDADPKSRAARAAPPASQPLAPRQASRPTHQADPAVTPLPSPEQIAATVRRQPIGAVIADICRDLGILPNHPLWRELQQVINAYRGNYARLVIDILTRRPLLTFLEHHPAATQNVAAAPAGGTGPP